MTDKEFVIRFMKMKQRLADSEMYFFPADRGEIMATTTNMQGVIVEAKALQGRNPLNYWMIFKSMTCPFCFIADDKYQGSCGLCNYGIRHGICSIDDDNDYETMFNQLGEWEEKGNLDYLLRKDQFIKDLKELCQEYDPDRNGLV